MIHRNVVFRNERVPEVPANAIDDAHDETRLWDRLERECLQAGTGCDVLAIPHNSNWSQGSMFAATVGQERPLDAALARRRAALEPLVEITQHKGDSECRAGGRDELCGFETPGFGDLAGHASSLYRSPAPPGVYVREALALGLELEREMGVNPFRLGIVGSTDGHMGAPGHVAEDAFVGHAAGNVSARLERPPLPDHPLFNPGGLAGVWAEENSRDALFAALRRRETFGTSGPRIRVRMFAGWRLDPELCRAPDFVGRADASGVPMGGTLPASTRAGDAPTLVVSALADPGSPGHPGGRLERIQIVKGWLDGDEARERVFDVAGSVHPGVGVDLATCAPEPGGHDALCSVWQDPDYDPASSAFYYARVVERPSCRWTTWACNAAAVDCGSDRPRGALAACCDPEVPRTIRERAWTSPVWVEPSPSLDAAG